MQYDVLFQRMNSSCCIPRRQSLQQSFVRMDGRNMEKWLFVQKGLRRA